MDEDQDQSQDQPVEESPPTSVSPEVPIAAPDQPEDGQAAPNYVGGGSLGDWAPGMNESQLISHITNPPAEQMHQEQMAQAQDLASRKIHPKTISDMFADQDLPSKLGLGISILLGGIGGGITHQGNGAVDYLNKLIERDYNAQKDSKEGANTYLSNQYNHELNQAHQKLINAQSAQIPLTNGQIKANTRNLDEDAKLKAQNGTINGLKIYLLQHADDAVQKLPPDQQAAAQQTIDTQLKQPIIAGMIDSNNQTAAQLQARAALRGLPGLGAAGFQDGQDASDQQQPQAAQAPAAGPNTGVDIDKLNSLINKGKVGASMDIPVGMNQAESSEALKEAQLVQDNRAVAKMFSDSFQNLNNMTAGKLTPDARAAEINALGAQIARATTGQYNSAEAVNQARAMFPEPGDLPETRKEKFRKAMQHFQVQEAATPTLQRFKLKQPFPKYTGDAPKEGETGTANGKKVVFKNGAWRAQ